MSDKFSRLHLPEIPLIDVGRHMGPASASAAPGQLENIIRSGYRRYTPPGVFVADILSSAWITRTENPYAPELREVADIVGRRGVHMLNLSYEWACTSFAVPDAAKGGNTLCRVLDWPFAGLGANLIVAKAEGEAGKYLNFCWPGYVGVITGTAPGRFSASINQPPMLDTGRGLIGNWVAGRRKFYASKALPPSHLLRMVFDKCRTFEEAKRMLEHTSVSLPVFYTLSGVAADEGCVIERLPDSFRTRCSSPAVANHWVDFELGGEPRGSHSLQRLAMAKDLLRQDPCWRMSWIQSPILNQDTRVVAMMNASSGEASVQGYENGIPATRRRTDFDGI